MIGFVLFRLGDRDLAAPLEDVREVARGGDIETLAGTRAPVSGLLELHGRPLPVVDVRTEEGGGDVLVLADGPEGSVGLAVDRVLAVLGAHELTVDEAPLPVGLPAYVVGLLRDADRRVVLLVAPRALAGLLVT